MPHVQEDKAELSVDILGKQPGRQVVERCGHGSKLNHQGTAGFGPWFHLPGCHVGYIFLTHSHVERCDVS